MTFAGVFHTIITKIRRKIKIHHALLVLKGENGNKDKKTIEGLSPSEITDKYALPVEPTHVCEVVVSKELELQTGIANGIEGWGNGGGRQYDTRGVYLPESAFINERPLE